AVGFELANPGPVGVARAPTIGEEKSGKLRKLKRLTGEGIVQGNASLITTSNQSPYRHCGFSRRPKARRTASTSRMSTAACTVAISAPFLPEAQGLLLHQPVEERLHGLGVPGGIQAVQRLNNFPGGTGRL